MVTKQDSERLWRSPTSLSENLRLRKPSVYILASHSEEFSTWRESDNVNIAIEEKQLSLVEVSLVWRHLPEPDLHLVPRVFVSHEVVHVVHTAISKHVTQRRVNTAASVSMSIETELRRT